ncbi:MAG TPA: hypothetical protein VEU47_12555 [Candidatus Cybelea sp.]|nr:hypothetical protein [Candidatus Cybelea sp.]
MRIVASILLLAALGACSGGPIWQDTNERLQAYHETSCASGADSDFRRASAGTSFNCGGYAAGQRDLYIDSARSMR